MPRRSYRQYGVEPRRLSIALYTDEWAIIDRTAKELSWSVPRLVEEYLKNEAATERVRRDKRPGVYYDAQGREHEEADA